MIAYLFQINSELVFMSKIIRISKSACEKLNQLEEDMGTSKQIIIERAPKNY